MSILYIITEDIEDVVMHRVVKLLVIVFYLKFLFFLHDKFHISLLIIENLIKKFIIGIYKPYNLIKYI